jgi:hypothetical protein
MGLQRMDPVKQDDFFIVESRSTDRAAISDFLRFWLQDSWAGGGRTIGFPRFPDGRRTDHWLAQDSFMGGWRADNIIYPLKLLKERRM